MDSDMKFVMLCWRVESDIGICIKIIILSWDSKVPSSHGFIAYFKNLQRVLDVSLNPGGTQNGSITSSFIHDTTQNHYACHLFGDSESLHAGPKLG